MKIFQQIGSRALNLFVNLYAANIKKRTSKDSLTHGLYYCGNIVEIWTWAMRIVKEKKVFSHI